MNLTWTNCILPAIIGGILFIIVQIAIRSWRVNHTPNRRMTHWDTGKVTLLEQSTVGRLFIQERLSIGMCPLCGNDTHSRFYGGSDQLSDHWCTKCSYITRGEVLGECAVIQTDVNPTSSTA